MWTRPNGWLGTYARQSAVEPVSALATVNVVGATLPYKGAPGTRARSCSSAGRVSVRLMNFLYDTIQVLPVIAQAYAGFTLCFDRRRRWKVSRRFLPRWWLHRLFGFGQYRHGCGGCVHVLCFRWQARVVRDVRPIHISACHIFCLRCERDGFTKPPAAPVAGAGYIQSRQPLHTCTWCTVGGRSAKWRLTSPPTPADFENGVVAVLRVGGDEAEASLLEFRLACASTCAWFRISASVSLAMISLASSMPFSTAWYLFAGIHQVA